MPQGSSNIKIAEKNTIRILLVEDDPADRDYFVELCRSEPRYLVSTCSTLSEACLLLEQQSFDVLVLDLSLPDSRGFETVERVRKIAPRTPVIILSGHEDEAEITESVLSCGARDYLMKSEISASLIRRSIRYTFEHKKLMDEIFQRDKLAAIGTLCSGVAHELNNPLTVALSHTRALQKQTALPEDAKDRLKKIERGCERMSNIIRHMLHYTRKTDTFNHASWQNVSLHEVIEESFIFFGQQLQTAGIDIDLNLNAIDDIVAGDRTQLESVLQNLISNSRDALKHRSMGGRRVISIATSSNSSTVLLEFYDNGAGMADETLDKVFDPFFTTKDVGEGTGLGMSVTKEILAYHGASVQVHSQRNQGTRFRISFSLAQAKEKGVQEDTLRKLG